MPASTRANPRQAAFLSVLGLGLVAGLALAGCGDSEIPVPSGYCVDGPARVAPGVSIACECPLGGAGRRTCRDGALLACQCSGIMVDAGAAPADGGTSDVDAGGMIIEEDAGATTSDAGAPPADAGLPDADAGSAAATDGG